jgi:hypothetical protein
MKRGVAPYKINTVQKICFKFTEYWFRCLDVDGDGVISPYELQFFYSEQENRIESFGIEPLHFSNVYCQIVDMLHCSETGTF